MADIIKTEFNSDYIKYLRNRFYNPIDIPRHVRNLPMYGENGEGVLKYNLIITMLKEGEDKYFLYWKAREENNKKEVKRLSKENNKYYNEIRNQINDYYFINKLRENYKINR